MIFIYFMVTNFWMCARFFSFGPSPPSPPFPLHASWLMCLDIRISSTTAAVYLFECVSHVYLPFRMHRQWSFYELYIWIYITFSAHCRYCCSFTQAHTHIVAQMWVPRANEKPRENWIKKSVRSAWIIRRMRSKTKQIHLNWIDSPQLCLGIMSIGADRERASGWTGERTMEQRRAKAPRTKG